MLLSLLSTVLRLQSAKGNFTVSEYLFLYLIRKLIKFPMNSSFEIKAHSGSIGYDDRIVCLKLLGLSLKEYHTVQSGLLMMSRILEVNDLKHHYLFLVIEKIHLSLCRVVLQS